MTTHAIENVVKELEKLPDSHQSVIVDFLRGLTYSPSGNSMRRDRNPALKVIDGLLVFTGEVEFGNTDWLQLVRDERESELARVVSNGDAPS